MRTARSILALLAVLAACANPAPAPPPQPAQAAGNFVVYFVTGDATVTPEAQLVIANAAAAAQGRPDKLFVEGHADGGATTDAALADRRALAVMRALSAAGVDASRIVEEPGAPTPGEAGVAAHQVIIRFAPAT